MKILNILLLQLCCLSLIAQNGAIDPTFGLRRISNTTQIRSIKAFPNGNVLICGNHKNVIGPQYEGYVATYAPDGALIYGQTNSLTDIAYACDTIQGGVGLAVCPHRDSLTHFVLMTTDNQSLDFDLPSDFFVEEVEIFDLKTQPDGYILLCGRCKFAGINQFFITRLVPFAMGGTGIDVQFGIDGMMNIPFGTDAQARSMAIQSDGKIIVVGHEIAPDRYGVVTRLLPNGYVDTSFNSGYGYIKKALSSPNNFWEYYTVSVDAQDVIYCGGASSSDAVLSAISPNGHSLYDIFSNSNDKAYFTSTATGHSLFMGGVDDDFGVTNNTLSSAVLIATPQSYATYQIDTSFEVGNGTQYTSAQNDNAIYGSCFNRDGNLLLCGTYSAEGFITMLDISKQYTSVSEVAAPFACSIYPNPTSGRLHIKTEERLTSIDIMTFTGQVVHHGNGSKTDIDMTDLSDGSYILAVHSDKGQTTYSRFVKAGQ